MFEFRQFSLCGRQFGAHRRELTMIGCTLEGVMQPVDRLLRSGHRLFGFTQLPPDRVRTRASARLRRRARCGHLRRGVGRSRRGSDTPFGQPALHSSRYSSHLATAVGGEHVVHGAVEEHSVVAGDHERSGPIVEESFEGPQRVEVEIVGGFVKHQQVWFGGQHHDEQQASSLPSREHSHRGELCCRIEPKPFEEHPVLPVRLSERPGDEFSYNRIRVERARLLIGVSDHHRGPSLHFSCGWLGASSDDVEQRRLSSAVWADYAQASSRLDQQIDADEHLMAAVRLSDVDELDDLIAESSGAGIEQQIVTVYANFGWAAIDQLVGGS